MPASFGSMATVTFLGEGFFSSFLSWATAPLSSNSAANTARISRKRADFMDGLRQFRRAGRLAGWDIRVAPIEHFFGGHGKSAVLALRSAAKSYGLSSGTAFAIV